MHQAVQVSSLTTRKQSNLEQFPTVLLTLATQMTPGFKSIRQAGESISVMLVLEDGQVAWGDCAAVQYSGAGGRDPLFLAEDFIPVIDKYIKPALVRQRSRQLQRTDQNDGSNRS